MIVMDDDDYDEGVERSYTGHIRDTDPDDGSFASGFRSDDDDVYTSTGYDDDEDRYRFEQEYARNQSRATAPQTPRFNMRARFIVHISLGCPLIICKLIPSQFLLS
ncbi:hypothetical protein MHU86_21248 [Fragilaria crotonensis]|nr:hypothetical protein MHU86_21248 [Fragilaria crotonensis]